MPGPSGESELYSKVSPTADLLPQTHVVGCSSQTCSYIVEDFGLTLTSVSVVALLNPTLYTNATFRPLSV